MIDSSREPSVPVLQKLPTTHDFPCHRFTMTSLEQHSMLLVLSPERSERSTFRAHPQGTFSGPQGISWGWTQGHSAHAPKVWNWLQIFYQARAWVGEIWSSLKEAIWWETSWSSPKQKHGSALDSQIFECHMQSFFFTTVILKLKCAHPSIFCFLFFFATWIHNFLTTFQSLWSFVFWIFFNGVLFCFVLLWWFMLIILNSSVFLIYFYDGKRKKKETFFWTVFPTVSF